MIDVADLPDPVRRCVTELGDQPDRYAVLRCRVEALTRVDAALNLWNCEEWAQVHRLLALACGYLTAADRFAEETAA